MYSPSRTSSPFMDIGTEFDVVSWPSAQSSPIWVNVGGSQHQQQHGTERDEVGVVEHSLLVRAVASSSSLASSVHPQHPVLTVLPIGPHAPVPLTPRSLLLSSPIASASASRESMHAVTAESSTGTVLDLSWIETRPASPPLNLVPLDQPPAQQVPAQQASPSAAATEAVQNAASLSLSPSTTDLRHLTASPPPPMHPVLSRSSRSITQSQHPSSTTLGLAHCVSPGSHSAGSSDACSIHVPPPAVAHDEHIIHRHTVRPARHSLVREAFRVAPPSETLSATETWSGDSSPVWMALSDSHVRVQTAIPHPNSGFNSNDGEARSPIRNVSPRVRASMACARDEVRGEQHAVIAHSLLLHNLALLRSTTPVALHRLPPFSASMATTPRLGGGSPSSLLQTSRSPAMGPLPPPSVPHWSNGPYRSSSSSRLTPSKPRSLGPISATRSASERGRRRGVSSCARPGSRTEVHPTPDIVPTAPSHGPPGALSSTMSLSSPAPEKTPTRPLVGDLCVSPLTLAPQAVFSATAKQQQHSQLAVQEVPEPEPPRRQRRQRRTRHQRSSTTVWAAAATVAMHAWRRSNLSAAAPTIAAVVTAAAVAFAAGWYAGARSAASHIYTAISTSRLHHVANVDPTPNNAMVTTVAGHWLPLSWWGWWNAVTEGAARCVVEATVDARSMAILCAVA
ncbi:hypothetical protein BC828DRAFT_406900 [Blastocladiella britannica]|nr:hypothetical protein BC828DRAFT_406900 [Blastocladiella britannica]